MNCQRVTAFPSTAGRRKSRPPTRKLSTLVRRPAKYAWKSASQNGSEENRFTLRASYSTSPVLAGASYHAAVLQHFRRITTSGGFIPEIDGLRFVAISTVVLFHIFSTLEHRFPQRYAPPPHNPLAFVAGH